MSRAVVTQTGVGAHVKWDIPRKSGHFVTLHRHVVMVQSDVYVKEKKGYRQFISKTVLKTQVISINSHLQ